MTVTKVGMSEREYYIRDNEEAYIVLNNPKAFNVYVRKNGRTHFAAEYKTYNGAKRYLTKNGYVVR